MPNNHDLRPRFVRLVWRCNHAEVTVALPTPIKVGGECAFVDVMGKTGTDALARAIEFYPCLYGYESILETRP